ncbi:MAG TPA: NUDIX hydrolase [Planctomycetota bacterium]|nr:NUDIX hydrolase [Planctomycetota bacterium]
MKFRVEAEETIFQGRIIRLVARDLVLPNGRRTTYHIVEHPGAVAIVPVHANGDVVLLKQFRPTIGSEIYEIPAGTIEKGEAPLATAKREIIEETGLRATRWSKIAEFYTAPGFCTELMHVYVAKGLRPASAEGDADEILRPVRMSLEAALRLIRAKKIRDAKTIAGLMIYHGRR